MNYDTMNLRFADRITLHVVALKVPMLIRKSAPLRKLNMQLHLSFVSKLLINEIDTVFKAL